MKYYTFLLSFFSSLILTAQVTVKPVLGSQELAVVPFDYALDGNEIPVSTIENGLFNSASSIKAFFEEASYGKMTISGTVYPYRTNQPPLYGTGYTNCYPEDSVLANQPDVDYTIIDGIILFPHDTSSSASCAAGLSSSEKLPFNTADGFQEFRRSGFRTEFYFPNDFSQTTSSTIAHELMHSFGSAFHSNSYIKDNGNWVIQGYGNVFDVLGLRSQASHPCSMLKHKLGWLTENEIALVQQTDTFRIHALEKTLPNQTQALIIELPNIVDIQPTDTFLFDRLYLEYRGLTGFDSRPSTLRRVQLQNNTYYPNDDIHGLSIIGTDCITHDECLPILIDMHPEPIGGVGANYFPHEASDAPLKLGETYMVPNNDITIEVINVDEENYIDIVISMPEDTSGNVGTTIIHSRELEGVSIYPNPVKDYVWINNSENKSLEFKLYDLFGKLIVEEFNTNFIDMGNLSDGVYMLSIKESNTLNFKTKRVVKIK